MSYCLRHANVYPNHTGCCFNNLFISNSKGKYNFHWMDRPRLAQSITLHIKSQGNEKTPSRLWMKQIWICSREEHGDPIYLIWVEAAWFCLCILLHASSNYPIFVVLSPSGNPANPLDTIHKALENCKRVDLAHGPRSCDLVAKSTHSTHYANSREYLTIRLTGRSEWHRQRVNKWRHKVDTQQFLNDPD